MLVPSSAQATQTSELEDPLLAASLNIRLQTEQPILSLPVVADLAAADHAVDIVAASAGDQRHSRA